MSVIEWIVIVVLGSLLIVLVCWDFCVVWFILVRLFFQADWDLKKALIKAFWKTIILRQKDDDNKNS